MSVPTNQIQRVLAQQAAAVDNFYTMFFTYSLVFAAIASAGTGTQQLTIQADSDFLIQMLAYVAIDNTTGLAVPTAGATLQLTDTGSGMNLFDQPQEISNAFGSAQLPFILPTPRLMTKNSSLTGNLVAAVLANATTFYFAFHGQRIYKK